MSAPGYRVPAEIHEALAAAGTPAWVRIIEQAVDRVLAEHGFDVGNVRVVEEHEDGAFYAYTVTFRYPGALRAEERVRMGAVERTFWAGVEAEASAQSVLLGDLRAGLALCFEDSE